MLSKLFTDPAEKAVKAAQSLVDQINTEEQKLHDISDGELQSKVESFRDRLQAGESTTDLLPEVFAVVKNACGRIVGTEYEVNGQKETWEIQAPYDVQLLGGIMLHQGRIAEMKTGEGKTLVASLPTVLEALAGKGVHVVTVNDYLARRDAEWMRPLYEFLGMTVGILINETQGPDRKAAYEADITYGTNNEFGFDYLRDNMASSAQRLMQRDLHFAVVDEVDSILIDEARTPLIISAPAEESTSKYQQYAKLVNNLSNDTHYVVDEKRKTAVLTEQGIAKMEELLGVENIYTDAGFSEVHHIENALRANFVYEKDKDYVVKDGQVTIVDEFTGRLMAGRRYGDGLHQAIEAAEAVEIKRESKTLATITFQNYFRLYDKLCGMTGTAKTEEEEFLKIYGLEVAVIPTNRPIARIDSNDLVFKNERGKYLAIANKVAELHANGQPVLIGTISIEKSEALSAALRQKGITHEVLNAKNHAGEAQIVADAGQMGAVTIATNMAGRGTDIKLGSGVTEVGGLFILGSERHESRRIDNQLRGRAGRQGDPGETQFFVSLEDSLMRLFGSERLQNLMNTLKIPDDMPIENRIISGSIESAQKKVEGHHFDVRKHVVQYDDVMNRQREIIYGRRRALLQKGDVHEEIVKWTKSEAQGLAHLHLTGRQPHNYDLESFQKGLAAIHADGAPTIADLESLEVEDKIAAVAEEFLLKTLDKKAKDLPEEKYFRQAERMITLRTIDQFWMNHIDEMTHLREQVALRAYAQKNPLQEYKSEGFEKFRELLKKIEGHVVRTLLQMQLEIKFGDEMPAQTPKKLLTNAQQIAQNLTARDTVDRAGPPVRVARTPVSGPVTSGSRPATNREVPDGRISADDQIEAPAAGRNEPCPCGSGKKYKKCHGQNS